MNELIKIGTTRIGDGTVQTVNARDLQKFLGIKKDFSNWIKNQIDRARLVEGRDYVKVPQKGELSATVKIGTTTIGGGTVHTVNARDLHEFLGIEQDFSDWIKNQIKRARLVENRDYILLPNFREQDKWGGSNKTEYFLTIDAAKHVSMICSKEKGFEVREYFIECEKIALSPAVPQIDQPQTVTQLHKNQLEATAITEKSYRIHLRAAKTYGLKDNQAVLSAISAAKEMVGYDLMKHLGVTHLIADDQDRCLTPTEIGRIANIGLPQEVYKRLGVSGFKIDRYVDYDNQILWFQAEV